MISACTVNRTFAHPGSMLSNQRALGFPFLSRRLKCPYCPMEQNPSHAKQIYFWYHTASRVWVKFLGVVPGRLLGPVSSVLIVSIKVLSQCCSGQLWPSCNPPRPLQLCTEFCGDGPPATFRVRSLSSSQRSTSFIQSHLQTAAEF